MDGSWTKNGEEGNIYRWWSLKVRDYFEDLDVDGRILNRS